MPWSCQYDGALDAFLVTGTGTVTEVELVTGLQGRADALLRHPTARVFHDYTMVTDIKISTATFFKLAAEDLGRKLPLRRAVLVSSPIIGGTVSFILSQNLQGELKIFYDRGAALQWINAGQPTEKWIR